MEYGSSSIDFIDALTRLANQFGPFLFAILFTVVVVPVTYRNFKTFRARVQIGDLAESAFPGTVYIGSWAFSLLLVVTAIIWFVFRQDTFVRIKFVGLSADEQTIIADDRAFQRVFTVGAALPGRNKQHEVVVFVSGSDSATLTAKIVKIVNNEPVVLLSKELELSKDHIVNVEAELQEAKLSQRAKFAGVSSPVSVGHIHQALARQSFQRFGHLSVAVGNALPSLPKLPDSQCAVVSGGKLVCEQLDLLELRKLDNSTGNKTAPMPSNEETVSDADIKEFRSKALSAPELRQLHKLQMRSFILKTF